MEVVLNNCCDPQDKPRDKLPDGLGHDDVTSKVSSSDGVEQVATVVSVPATPNGDVSNNGKTCSNGAPLQDLEEEEDDAGSTIVLSDEKYDTAKEDISDDDDDDDRTSSTMIKTEDVQIIDASKSDDDCNMVVVKESKTKDEDQDDEVDLTEEDDDKEQTIIITETKSLAKAINDAVKTPDGKPTLVIIETKPSSVAVTTTTTAASTTVTTSATAQPAVVSTTTSIVSSATNKMVVTTTQRLTSEVVTAKAAAALTASGRQSILQGTLLAPPRVTLKPDGGPSVPLPDDAEVVVDVPSLVVPYLFECQARETLSQFLKKLGTSTEEDGQKAKTLSSTDEAIEAVVRGGNNKTFFDTSLGKFFVDIGLAQVQEWVQEEILKAQRRKLARGWRTKEREKMVASLQTALRDAKTKNSQFQFELRRCTRCSFQSESRTVLDKHMETIHMVGTKMPCCFCDFETVVPAAIYNHLYSKHHVFARIDKFNGGHMCPFCPFEDANKSRVTRHMWKCQKAFDPDKNLAPPTDYEPPAKRTRLVASVSALKNMSAAAARAGGVSQLAPRPPPQPIRPKPGELRITPSYVQSVLRSTYLGGTSQQALRTAASTAAAVVTRGPQQRSSAATPAGTILLPRQSYALQPSQLYQVVHSGAGGVVPVVRPSAAAFHSTTSTPRFTILPTPPATVTTRGPTPVALIPNLATSQPRPTTPSSKPSSMLTTAVSLASTLLVGQATGRAAPVSSQPAARPNISITPVSKALSSAVRSAAQTTVAQQQQHQQGSSLAGGGSGGGSGGNPSYVVCEICDGYIKDLDQLRNHMQWIHKVKIHPKMIHNRPPLNCQKCHYRFFTDQGLERHLLGSHGLVTSSMQENANKGKDGGRCIICGKVFLWKLVVHMAKDHKMTLKPAHLSYKCTVCSATFNMYRLFETHVYEEHSTVAKRVLDTPKSGAVGGGGSVVATASAGGGTVVLPAKKTTAPAIPATKEVKDDASVPQRSCVECGIKFKCSSNCIQHLKESHVKPCHVKLCRVDKCEQCSAKAKDEEKKKAVVEAPKRPANDDAKNPSPPSQLEDDVFDMEVETVDDHSSPGSVHTDVESD